MVKTYGPLKVSNLWDIIEDVFPFESYLIY